jgi:phospholipase C
MKPVSHPPLPLSRLSLALLGVLLVVPAPTRAADQTVLGAKFSVQDTGVPEKRKVSFQAKEKGTDNTIVGDPVANGATLNIHLTGGTVDGQTFTLPAGPSPLTGKPFWTGDALKGFKYKDAKGENGPVASVQISNKKGTFQIKVNISGKLGLITILPPNPGTDGCGLLTINGGDSYSVNFATGVASNKDAKLFKISKPTLQNSCIRSNPNNLPIDHIVVMMQENRSADVYFSQLSTQGQPDYEPASMAGNPDPTNPFGPPIVPFHKTSYCEVFDLDHSWKGTHNEVHNGLMDGFTNQNKNPGLDPNGHRTMGYYDSSDLPIYYGLLSTFATGDRYFSSVQSQTFPNRLYLLAGSSFGHIRNDVAFPMTVDSIFNLLDQHGITWRIYANFMRDAYGPIFFQYVANQAETRVVPLSQYYTDVANGTLPNVAFIDPNATGTPKTENDEHPIANVQVGQKFVADVINGLLASPTWASTALFLTWDEHGGFYDHVPPPPAVPPDAILPMWLAGDPHELFDEYGVRVGVVAVSPYSKASFVSHVVHDHTSILKFIETRFGLPSLSARDAAADPMLEFFDFNTATFAVPPSLPTAVVDPVKLAACPG